MRHSIWTISAMVLAALSINAIYLGYDAYQANIFSECQIDIRDSIPSPDGRNSVVIFEKKCGATVGFNVQATIVPNGGSIDQYVPFFVARGHPEVFANWHGNTTVEVSTSLKPDQAFRRNFQVENIKVVYH